MYMAKDLKPITKRYSLTTEERTKVQNLQSVLGILALQSEGIRNSLMLELARTKSRNGIKENQAPEGFVRNVDFDPDKFEIVVTDIPVPEKPAEVKNDPNEAKN
jgi:hypothetical protein